MMMHPTLWDFTRSTLQISFLTALHRRIIWSSSQLSVKRRPSLLSSSVLDRNHTPLSGALSQVCVLENVSHSCNHQHFSGIFYTSKAYRLYDEANKKFIVSREVISLEFDTDEIVVDKQLARLDRFHSKIFYHEWDNELPNIEGGILVLDQSLKFPCTTTTSSSDSPLENVENEGEEILNDNMESKPVLE
jgi:hypothetical protein